MFKSNNFVGETPNDAAVLGGGKMISATFRKRTKSVELNVRSIVPSAKLPSTPGVEQYERRLA